MQNRYTVCECEIYLWERRTSKVIISHNYENNCTEKIASNVEQILLRTKKIEAIQTPTAISNDSLILSTDWVSSSKLFFLHPIVPFLLLWKGGRGKLELAASHNTFLLYTEYPTMYNCWSQIVWIDEVDLHITTTLQIHFVNLQFIVQTYS